MSTRTREHIVAIDDSGKAGLYESFDSSARIETPQFFRGDSERIGWRFAKAAPASSGVPFSEVDPADWTVKVSLFTSRDKAPTAGSFTLNISTGGDSDTTSAITYDATASAFQTAFNTALAGASVSQTATVSKQGVDYIATLTAGVTGITQITSNAAGLTPECQVIAKCIRTGASGVGEIWRISVSQKGLAYLQPSDAYPTLTGPIGATTVQEGGQNQKAIQSMTLDPVPYGGTAKWTFTVRQLYRVTCVEDVAGSLNNQVLATFKEPGVGDGDDIQIYGTTGSGSPPGAPAQGRQISFSYSSGATAEEYALAAFDAIAMGGDTISALDLDGASFTISTQVAGFVDGTTGATFSRTRVQQTLVAALAWGASADDIATASEGLWDVEITEDGKFLFTCTENGAQTAVSLNGTDLIVPKGVEGELDFDTLAAIQEFAATTEDSLDATYEIEITPSGEGARTVLSVPAAVLRDNIRSA